MMGKQNPSNLSLISSAKESVAATFDPADLVLENDLTPPLIDSSLLPLSEVLSVPHGNILPTEGHETVAFFRDFRHPKPVPTEEELFNLIKSSFVDADDESAKKAAERITRDLTREFGAKADPALTLPKVAPELYADRKVREDLGRKESALEFYDRVWSPYHRAGVLYRDQLHHLDDKIIPAVKSQCQREKLDAKTILPPAKYARTDPVSALDRNRKAARDHYHRTKIPT